MRDLKTAFSPNPQSRLQLARIGVEGEIIALVDDFFLHPEQIVDYAADGLPFSPAGAGYPGIRAAVPEIVNHALYHALGPILNRVFRIGDDEDMTIHSSFSMLTQGAAPLAVGQRLPHFDTADAKALAVVIYLCDPKWGGTGFYRHKSTGFETVSPERDEAYNRRVAEELSATVLPEHFPDDKHPLFERFETVEPKFNRLVLYRSRLLHSAAVAPDAAFSDDARKGRLTITSFLKVTAP